MHAYLNRFYLVLTAALLLAAFGPCKARAGSVTSQTPLISLDRAYPYAAYKVDSHFNGLTKSESHWHGALGVGVAYVLTDRIALSSAYYAGLKSDSNSMEFKVQVWFKR